MHIKLQLLFIAFLFPLLSFAQVQKLLDPNLETNTQSSNLRSLSAYKGSLYAYAESGDDEGLWRLDTVRDEMELVVPDINIFDMVATDSLLIMIAANYSTGFTIWKSDGTIGGTQPLANAPAAYFRELESHGNFAFFSARDPRTNALSLWSTNGSVQGTHYLKDIGSPLFSGFRKRLAIVNGKAYFFGIKGQNGIAIYDTDGTPAGTRERYSKTEWGNSGGSPWNLVAADSLVYFLESNDNKVDLWQLRQDTVLLISRVPDGVNRSLGHKFEVKAFTGHHYFYGGRARIGPPLDSLYLCRTNGTLGDLDTVYTFPDVGSPAALFSVDHGLLAIVRDQSFQAKMWTYTANGMSNSAISLPNSSFFGQEAISNDSVAVFNLNSYSIMRSDGTSNGTYLLQRSWQLDYNLSPDGVRMGDQLYLSMRADSVGQELFSLQNGVLSLITDTERTPVNASIRNLSLTANGLVFSAYGDAVGREIWKSDGTPGGSGLLKDLLSDILPISDISGSYPSNFLSTGDLAYFSARDSNGSFVPFVTDATVNGTRRITDLWTRDYQTPGFNLVTPIYWQDKVYFTAAVPVRGIQANVEMYQYDPITDTAILVKEIEPFSSGGFGIGSFPNTYTASNEYLFFLAKTVNEDLELWRTDGTENGTILVKDILPGIGSGFQDQNSSFPASFLGLDSLLLFTANNRTDGWQLWRSNGTESGTYPLQDTLTYRRLGYLNRLGDVGIFWESDFSNGVRLWSTDGSDAATRILLDQIPVSANHIPRTLYADEQIGFFTVDVDSIGVELWKTDGTPGGTQILKDLVPGPKSSDPNNLILVGNNQYMFWAEDSTGDRILWSTDGTSSGTFPVLDYVQAGAGLINENRLILGNGFLYFIAEDIQSGESLFRYNLSTTGLFEGQSISPFLVYPNPTNGRLKIQLKDKNPVFLTSIKLFDLQGKQVQEFPISQALTYEMEIKLSEHILPGYYFLGIETKTGLDYIKLSVK